jgi:hypothetical protein
MDREKNADRVWDIVERVGVCMLTTRGSTGLRARQPEARPNRSAKTIWFITDVRSSKEQEIAANNDVGLVFIDKRSKHLPVDHRPRRGTPQPKSRRVDLENDRQYAEAYGGVSTRVVTAGQRTPQARDGAVRAALLSVTRW